VVSKLLVTGASGYLGTALCAHAAREGWDVVGTYLTHAPDGVRAVALDVRDGAAAAALVAREAPDVVVHTAYRQDGDDASAINADGAANVAAAAQAAGARLVHVSSDVVFGGDGDRPLREDDPVGPVTAYGATKAAAEERVAALAPAAAIARTSLLYGGPGAPPSKHEELILAVARGERELTFFDDEVRCPVHVGELAAALLELAGTGHRGPLHVAGADAVDRLTFARLVAAARGADPDRLSGRPAPPDRPRNCALDSGRARALLRAPLRGVRDVLR
jgi:dTDP-4-dehydrorhamnose reductase